MPFFTTPTSFTTANYIRYPSLNHDLKAPSKVYQNVVQFPNSASQHAFLPPHSSHPNFGHLTLLVFEAVLEVVCVSLPGYIVARQGLFNEENQKFIAYLNILLFTPCLIFNKLGSQLTADKLMDLAVIPVIFVVQVAVSYVCSILMTKAFGFSKRPRNFVIAMGVFGNSNSLPISLVLSLSQTIRGLHWDKIPGDNDDEVAARGILYLLIFQQLGQLLRWSWGINVLLKKEENDEMAEENLASRLERGNGICSNPPLDGYEPLPNEPTDATERDSTSSSSFEPAFESGGETPVTNKQYTSSISSKGSSVPKSPQHEPPQGIIATPANGNIVPSYHNDNTENGVTLTTEGTLTNKIFPVRAKDLGTQVRQTIRRGLVGISRSLSAFTYSIDQSLPTFARRVLGKINAVTRKITHAIWQSLNPPLLAMGAALLVASIPSLQRLFFSDGTFVKNSITSAIRQSGGVAVPLILVVLGANLARGSKHHDRQNEPDSKVETRLLIASLLSRMVLPTVVMAPLLAIAAKYIPVSILDDPIFVIVCFLLAGAPSALQLAQICQINEVYMGAMTRILFHSYVIWILPSTLILVMCALEVVEWAA